MTLVFLLSFIVVAESIHTPVIIEDKENPTANATTDIQIRLNDTGDKLYHENSKFQSPDCILQVNRKSKIEFTENILKNKYNFVYLKLNFVNFTINATQNVIAKNEWIWTYEGEKGAHQYLFIPEDFGYLSFELLWAHTLKERMTVNIEKSGKCNNLVIGNEDTDYRIGKALGEMTSKIASKQAIYNSSYWCYNKRIWHHSKFIYMLCKNWICIFQTITYECCKFTVDHVTNRRNISCHFGNHRYGAIWWVLPFVTGNICFAFYPLLLTRIGMKIKKISKAIKRDRDISAAIYSYAETPVHGNNEIRKSDYISLKSSNLISVSSTVMLPIFAFVFGASKGSRALRIWIIILPMCIVAIKVLLGYIYADHFLKDAIRKGALDGFSALLTGQGEVNKHFMYVLGGPIVAISICFLFGFLLIVFPSNLEEFLTNGLRRRVKTFIFMVSLPLPIKEHMSGINVRRFRGCKKLHQLFLAQIFMLISLQFWKQSFKLFCLRWKNIIFVKIYKIFCQNTFAAIIISVIMLPCYIVFCVGELFFAVPYYLFPAVNCYFIILNSTCIHYNNYFKHKVFVLKCIQYVSFIPIVMLFTASWYAYSIMFLDAFLFLMRIVMLTYSGIVAYPKLSYGYMVLAFMTLYYVTESINAFGESYKDLLKLSLESCEKFQLKHFDDGEMDQDEIKAIRTKYGIKTDLFYFIINKDLPRRNQLLITILKLILVITVLIVSVRLFVTFDKFKELSVVTHVFTVLFICALPKILKAMCFKNLKHKTRHKMKQMVSKTITDYIRKERISNRNESDELEYVFVSKNFGYETLSVFGDNIGYTEEERDL